MLEEDKREWTASSAIPITVIIEVLVGNVFERAGVKLSFFVTVLRGENDIDATEYLASIFR
jgi:hypothetical protein